MRASLSNRFVIHDAAESGYGPPETVSHSTGNDNWISTISHGDRGGNPGNYIPLTVRPAGIWPCRSPISCLSAVARRTRTPHSVRRFQVQINADDALLNEVAAHGALMGSGTNAMEIGPYAASGAFLSVSRPLAKDKRRRAVPVRLQGIPPQCLTLAPSLDN